MKIHQPFGVRKGVTFLTNRTFLLRICNTMETRYSPNSSIYMYSMIDCIIKKLYIECSGRMGVELKILA